MATKAVAKQESSVPALVYHAPLEIEQEDIALPKLKIAQFSTWQVKKQLVVPGSLFTCTAKEDPDPVLLSEAKQIKGDWHAPDPIRIHVLGMTKGKSLSVDGELVLFGFDDPDAPADAWVTYNYVVTLPEFDDEPVAKFLLTKSGKPSAQSMNKVLSKAGSRPFYEIAFEVTTDERHNDKGDYFVPRVKHVDADPDHIKITEDLAQRVSASSFEAQATGDEPAI